MKCSECDGQVFAKGMCRKHYRRASSTRSVHPTRDMTEVERFEHYIKKTDTCWLWTGSVQGKYGTFWCQGKNQGAHRYSYTHFIGEIPNGMSVCHRCDNPICVNPDHLFVGLPVDNTRDMLDKGRGRWPSGTDHHLAKLSDEQEKRSCRLKVRNLNRA